MSSYLCPQLFDGEVVTLEADPAELGPRAVVFEEERAAVVRAVPKRQFEYLATRDLARRAFAKLDVPAQPLLNSPDRSPIWPEGLIGSLTHTAGWCGVAVSRPRALCRGLGVDAERIYDMSVEVAKRVLTEAEFERLNGMALPDIRERATLSFSAKEAVYKCVFPWVKRYIGFDEVEIDADASATQGEFGIRFVSEKLQAEHRRDDYALTGRFVRRDNLWVTGVTMHAATG